MVLMLQDKISMLSEEEANRKALELIRDKYGNLPYPAEPKLVNDAWEFSVNVGYPKVFYDGNGKPIKTRFINIKDVGKVVVSALTGEIISRSDYFAIKNKINENLTLITNSVEKALVKTSAHNFARLVFPEHFHTPIKDILAILLVNERFKLNDLLSEDDIIYKEKYEKYIQLLEETQLVRTTGSGVVVAGDAFTILEKMQETTKLNGAQKLDQLLATFFERGYESINSMREVLGTYLNISGYIYNETYEFGDILPFRSQTLETIFTTYHLESKKLSEKAIKIPRYLLELENVDLLTEDENSNGINWYAKKDIFNNLQKQDQILEPTRELLSK